MLTRLYIRNVALIEELEIPFHEGLTIITGETGAGKSILIGALNLVLGARASSELVRSGQQKAVVEAVLETASGTSGKLAELLQQAGIEQQPELIIRRELTPRGQSRAFVNDTPCPLQTLKRIGDELIDLHGQHEHQLLLREEHHIGLLDDYGQLQDLIEPYRNTSTELRQTRLKFEELKEKARRSAAEKELLEYQLKELQDLNLQEGEEAGLEEEIAILENAETLASHCNAITSLLYDNDRSAYVQVSEALRLLNELSSIDRTLEPGAGELAGAESLLEELSRTLRSYGEAVDFNPVRLEELQERHHLIQKMKKKYHRSVEELIAMQEEVAGELALQEHNQEAFAEHEENILELKARLTREALALHKARTEAAKRLEPLITKELDTLGIQKSTFNVRIRQEQLKDGDIDFEGTPCTAFRDGCDRVEFLISTNQGEAPRQLAKIASGGEISRVMLALKSALATNTRLPILIFDEIDTGISGRVAEAVGRSLQRLSSLHQIIAITHLPHIAAMGESHLFVEKHEYKGRTSTQVRELSPEEHLEAVARLIDGDTPSEASLAVASQLIRSGKNSKGLENQ
ncbi:DNA repair protein RecN [Prosthecochloris sp. CIB 2401]|uniref:DNA repair protein RecN n=1 Tax=Prosthecochloris sp. CIB 2401 TaxID=1868325 RepID=UPI00080A9DF0|nr:DNA repair protein RecN [Prosthecochloris sp. CIB 2401]ANT64357.1 Recombination protein N [Prosthecochloris sp. CIB 2401]